MKAIIDTIIIAFIGIHTDWRLTILFYSLLIIPGLTIAIGKLRKERKKWD